MSITLSEDGSHACAGATRIRATLREINGDSIESELDAAVAPEQADCDFGAGVAEGLWGAQIGSIDTNKPHVVSIELLDSTGLVLAVGVSDRFEASSKRGDPVEIVLTRQLPVGTALVDLYLEPAARFAGTLNVRVVGPATSSRDLDWPGDDSLKRPLRISGLPSGFGLFLELSLDGVEFETETFEVGDEPADAFVYPVVHRM